MRHLPPVVDAITVSTFNIDRHSTICPTTPYPNQPHPTQSLQAASAFWIMEQPKGSLMEKHYRISQFMTRFRVYRMHIRMLSYGADTDKGTWLYSSCKAGLDELCSHERPSSAATSKEMVVRCSGELNLFACSVKPQNLKYVVVETVSC